MKENADDGDGDGGDDYYGDGRLMPSDQAVVNLANFLANATNLEELNIRRCRPKSEQEQQMTVGAATEITGYRQIFPLKNLPELPIAMKLELAQKEIQ